MTHFSREYFLNYYKLIADVVLSEEHSSPIAHSFLSFVAQKMQRSQSFGKRGATGELFGSNAKQQYKSEERVKYLKLLVEEMYSHPETAKSAYNWSLYLARQDKDSEPDLSSFILRCLEADYFAAPSVSHRNYQNIEHHAPKGANMMPLEDHLCMLIKESETFSTEWLQNLKDSAPETAEVLETLISLSTLRGEAFQEAKKAVLEDWAQSNVPRRQALTQYMDKLIPYTEEGLKRDVEEICASIGDVNTRSHLVSQNLNLLFERIEADLDPSQAGWAFERIAKALLELDREMAKKTQGTMNYGRYGHSVLRNLVSHLFKKEKLIYPVLKASWEAEIPLPDRSYEIAQLFNQYRNKSEQELEQLLQCMLPSSDSDAFFPLVMYVSDSSNPDQVSEVKSILDRVSSTTKRSEPFRNYVQKIAKMEDASFAQLMTAGYFESDTKVAAGLIERAFQENAQALLNYEERQFHAVLLSTRRWIKFSQMSPLDGGDEYYRKLLDRVAKVQMEELNADIEAWCAAAFVSEELSSYDYKTLYAHFRRVQQIVRKGLELDFQTTYAFYQKYRQYYTMVIDYEAQHQPSRKASQAISSHSIFEILVSGLRGYSFEQAMEAGAILLSSEDASEEQLQRLYTQADSNIRSLIQSLTVTRDSSGKVRYCLLYTSPSPRDA